MIARDLPDPTSTVSSNPTWTYLVTSSVCVEHANTQHIAKPGYSYCYSRPPPPQKQKKRLLSTTPPRSIINTQRLTVRVHSRTCLRESAAVALGTTPIQNPTIVRLLGRARMAHPLARTDAVRNRRPRGIPRGLRIVCGSGTCASVRSCFGSVRVR